MQKFLIAFFLLAALAQTGNSLQCWLCSELLENSETCEDPFTKTAAMITCSSGQVCFKQATSKIIIGQLEIPSIVTRGCSDSAICESPFKDVSEYCSICNRNLCNSSGIGTPSLITVGALLIAVQCAFTFRIVKLKF